MLNRQVCQPQPAAHAWTDPSPRIGGGAVRGLPLRLGLRTSRSSWLSSACTDSASFAPSSNYLLTDLSVPTRAPNPAADRRAIARRWVRIIAEMRFAIDVLRR